MPSFSQLRETFKDFYESVKHDHQSNDQSHRGHGLDHDVVVAAQVLLIAPDERTSIKAWCAAMLHSTDRMYGDDDAKTRAVMVEHSSHLPHNFFTKEEVEEIIEAALRHSELNQPDHSLTQQVLMDADRLANLMLTVTIRGGQFRPNIPAVEFEYLEGSQNPESTYRIPRSVLDNVRASIEAYIPQLRIPRAIELGHEYATTLQNFISTAEKQYRDIGLSGMSL
jgi:hypothetical protein